MPSASYDATSVPRVVLIVNPFATAVDEQRLALVERVLSARADVETRATAARGDATRLAQEAARAADAIFVYSGDGGFNEVVNGLGPGAPPLACIPGGGTNVFPRVLGIPRDPAQAAEQLGDALARGRSRRISVARVNGRRFLFSAGVGFDAELVRRAERKRAGGGRPGDAAFAAMVLRLIGDHRGRFDPVLEIDGLGRAAFLLVAKADPYTYLGSMPVRVAPTATFEAGIDVVAPTRVRAWTLPRLLRYALTGRGQLDDASIITAHDLDRIDVRCDRPLPLQADGEDLGDVIEASFEVERAALSVLV
jgi:diacylglycerol kinase family enzyme